MHALRLNTSAGQLARPTQQARTSMANSCHVSNRAEPTCARSPHALGWAGRFECRSQRPRHDSATSWCKLADHLLIRSAKRDCLAPRLGSGSFFGGGEPRKMWARCRSANKAKRRARCNLHTTCACEHSIELIMRKNTSIITRPKSGSSIAGDYTPDRVIEHDSASSIQLVVVRRDASHQTRSIKTS